MKMMAKMTMMTTMITKMVIIIIMVVVVMMMMMMTTTIMIMVTMKIAAIAKFKILKMLKDRQKNHMMKRKYRKD